MTVFSHLSEIPPFRYQTILADPAWPFENYSAKGEGRNPNRHYDTMSVEQIAAMPVGHFAAPDCALFMWVTDPMLEQAFHVLKRWGFTYVTVAFTWAKRTKLDTGWHIGTGYYTRANPEMCLLAKIGSPGRPIDKGVRQLVVDPVRAHSRKPDRIHSDIERLYPHHLHRLELFSRCERPGWDAWGNEVGKFIHEQPEDQNDGRFQI